MRLSDLNPRWIGHPGPVYDGLAFDCPHCRQQRIAVHFSPAIDPGHNWSRVTQPSYVGVTLWRRVSGDTFDTITLDPSVNTDISGHWHGMIQDGNLITA